jgi:glycosyltransferase involved in cell wall biosynthesis
VGGLRSWRRRRADANLPQLGLFTITYRQPERLRATVADILAQDYPSARLEAVVLDDGSGDETAEIAERFRASAPFPVTLLTTEHEHDYHNSRRWNQCIASVGSNVDALVQIDDVRLRPDFLRQHAKWHTDAKLRLVTGAKFEAEGPEPVWDLRTCRRWRVSREGVAVPCTWLAVWGASMSYSRPLVDLVRTPPHENPYDERMLGWGMHEVDLAYRMHRAGAEVFYDPEAGVYHQLHEAPRESEQRRIDRAAAVSTGYEHNEEYFRQKHGIESLPWWSTE